MLRPLGKPRGARRARPAPSAFPGGCSEFLNTFPKMQVPSTWRNAPFRAFRPSSLFYCFSFPMSRATARTRSSSRPQSSSAISALAASAISTSFLPVLGRTDQHLSARQGNPRPLARAFRPGGRAFFRQAAEDPAGVARRRARFCSLSRNRAGG